MKKDFKPTPDQKKIIEARNKSLIVSAAAGSGKTAVLVDRIMGLIAGLEPDEADGDTVPGNEQVQNVDYTDIDRILVVTFTNAAAAEMKKRIRDALQKRIEKETGKPASLRDRKKLDNLRRQSGLISNARISTIDSFCQYVIRNSFTDIDIDPAFRIADEGENKLLESDVLNDLIERCYAEGDEEFLYMADHLVTGADDSALYDAVYTVYRKSQTAPWPYVWLDECSRRYDIPEGGGLPSEITGYIRSYFKEKLSITIDIYTQMLETATSGGFHEDYTALISSELDTFKNCYVNLNSEDITYSDMVRIASGISFETLTRKKGPEEDPALRSAVTDSRSAVKKDLNGFKERYLDQTEEEAARRISGCKRTVKALCAMCKRYMDALKEAKADRGILSFADCEHFALDILVQRLDERDENGNYRYEFTDAAAQYRSFYQYVFIDEYQDSNLIQELILSAVSGESEGIYNRFMVGDIKQSIYSFRQADPDIFMERYAQYEADGSDRIKVDLNCNFRSRKQVLDSCNALFERIMTKESGGADYDENASLKYGAEYPCVDDDAYVTEMIFTDPEQSEYDDPACAEGEAIAKRIDELINSRFQLRESEDTVRDITYSDIVIL